MSIMIPLELYSTNQHNQHDNNHAHHNSHPIPTLLHLYSVNQTTRKCKGKHTKFQIELHTRSLEMTKHVKFLGREKDK